MACSDLYDLVLEMKWDKAEHHCLQHPVDAAHIDGDTWETSLYLACQNRPPLSLIHVLLEAYPEATAVRSRHGDWPLHTACRCGASKDVLSELVTANPAIVEQTSKWGITAIQALWDSREQAQSGNNELTPDLAAKFDVLLEGLATNYLKRTGSSVDCGESNNYPCSFVLHAVVALRSFGCPYPVLEYVLNKYPEQVSMRDTNGMYPLHIACGPVSTFSTTRIYKPRERKFIVTLLNKYPRAASIAVAGRYPLHLALSSRHAWDGGVREILRFAPDILGISDPLEGVIPFQLAAIPVRDTFVDLNTVYQLLRAQPDLLRIRCSTRIRSIEKRTVEKYNLIVCCLLLSGAWFLAYHHNNTSCKSFPRRE